jgi:hypothetical protein
MTHRGQKNGKLISSIDYDMMEKRNPFGSLGWLLSNKSQFEKGVFRNTPLLYFEDQFSV